MSDRRDDAGVDPAQGPLAELAGEVPPAPAWFANVTSKPPERHFVDVEGTPIHYLRWGDRARPGLLLVHGNAAHAYWWSFIAPYLARDYNVAAMDLSGMGDSGWRESYAMETFGGFVTILTGALHGDQLAGTVIIDSPVNPPDRRPGGPPRRDLRANRVYATMAQALARFRLMPPQTCDNLYIVDWVARHSLKAVDGGFTWKFDPAIWRDFSIGDTAQRLRATKCRIAIFRGENSVLMPPEIGDYMFNLLGRAAPVVEIPQAKHHVLLDQPLALVAALRALLADWNHSTPNRRL